MQVDEKTIHDFCVQRWQHYEKIDNGYSPSKHDDLVIKEAASEFNLAEEIILGAFNKVSKALAEEEVKGMSQAQIRQALVGIVETNKDSPWFKK